MLTIKSQLTPNKDGMQVYLKTGLATDSQFPFDQGEEVLVRVAQRPTGEILRALVVTPLDYRARDVPVPAPPPELRENGTEDVLTTTPREF